jgi:hypothetical protein
MTLSFFFLLNEGMLSPTATVVEFAQNYPKLPNFVKICPKTISLRNFEIPPKLEILILFKKKNLVCRGRTKACAHHLDFQYNNFLYALLYCQKTPFVREFQHIPLWKIIFFSIFHTSCGYKIL